MIVPDPMREIDLLLLEEDMVHRKFESNARAKALQTVCVLLVLFSLAGVLVRELAHRGGGISLAPSQAVQQSGHGMATPDLHPNAQTP
jgi:hypothetical protein